MLGDSSFLCAPLARAVPAHDIHAAISLGSTPDERFLPVEIRSAIERLSAWPSRYRRLNVVFDHQPHLFAAQIWIAMISIISRRLVASNAKRCLAPVRIQFLGDPK